MKEVHHRVKNNLQIVIGLLNLQSDYLNDDVAVNAILESRHRIQAMAMLHQKIYQSDDMATISMTHYIGELVNYLKQSFNTGKQILFDFQIDEIDLDIVQAVPIGLILNEAITNSVKYAFPEFRDGKISISLFRKVEERIVLQVIDDGIGFPIGFNPTESESFGLKLIQGLAGDLDGMLTIDSTVGTSLTVDFASNVYDGYLPPKPGNIANS